MRRLRKQVVTIGGFKAVKLGMPLGLSDLYYMTMEMGWTAFVAVVAAVFVAVNLAFGIVYACLPGAIANLPPGSLVDGFFFSVETLATVGYGTLSPATTLGHVISAFEILVGLFFSATMTGLIFARFARPQDSLVFSDVAVIGRHLGKPALIVRVTSIRMRPLADARAQMAWLQYIDLPGGRTMRQLVDLPLVRSHNALMGLSWTLTHVLEENSQMLATLKGERPFNLTVTVSGLDTLLASQSVGGRSYRRENILFDHEFVDILSDIEGVVHLDFSAFHQAVPLPPVLTMGESDRVA